MDIQFFLFDWSGTLSDDRVPVFKANLLLCQDYGLGQTLTFEEWYRSATVSVVEWFQDRGVQASAEEIIDQYKRRFNEVITNDSAPTVYPDALDVLHTLRERGARLAVLSAHPEYNLKKEADAYGFYDYFDLIVGDCRNKTEGLKELLKMMGANPGQSLYVGDTVYDVRAAKDTGMISAAVTTGYHSAEDLESENPDYLFHALSDMKTLAV